MWRICSPLVPFRARWPGCSHYFTSRLPIQTLPWCETNFNLRQTSLWPWLDQMEDLGQLLSPLNRQSAHLRAGPSHRWWRRRSSATRHSLRISADGSLSKGSPVPGLVSLCDSPRQVILPAPPLRSTHTHRHTETWIDLYLSTFPVFGSFNGRGLQVTELLERWGRRTWWKPTPRRGELRRRRESLVRLEWDLWAPEVLPCSLTSLSRCASPFIRSTSVSLITSRIWSSEALIGSWLWAWVRWSVGGARVWKP